METINNVLSQEMIQRLGWTLVHFIWQAVAIGLILAVVLRWLKIAPAKTRYTLAGIALFLMVLLPAVTIRMVEVSTMATPSATATSPAIPANSLARVEIPQPQFSPPDRVAAMPRLSLKSRLIANVEPLLPAIVIGWMVGVLILSIWHLGGWTQLQRLRRQLVKQVEPALKAKSNQLAARLGIPKTIGIMESALVQVPMVVGHLKPVILLPASALTGLSTAQIEAILAHELAHIKRHDYLVNMLQTVVEILGFYHPAVWWVSRQIRVERENCCDDLAVGISGDRLCYARALTAMEEIRSGQPALAMAASGGSLLDRIRRLLGKDPAKEARLSWWPSLAALLLMIAVLVPATLALSGEKAEIKPDPLRVYQVNKSVSDFPTLEDMSTPESAYAAINRVMAADDGAGWVRLSSSEIKDKLKNYYQNRKKEDVNPEWSKTVLNARLLEVRIYGDQAVVIAEFPQEFSIKKVVDCRYLRLEEGQWLNTGEDRFYTPEEARAKFDQINIDQQKTKPAKSQDEIRQEKNAEAQRNFEIIRTAAYDLFRKIKDADYEHFLGNVNTWNEFPTVGYYNAYRDYPDLVQWICKTFKENPIVSIELGKENISQHYYWPRIYYKLTLQNGSVIEGDLDFEYHFYNGDQGRWYGIHGHFYRGPKTSYVNHGLDWHLQENPLKQPETPAKEGSSPPQISTTGYIFSVPADLPLLKEIASDDPSQAKAITMDKMEKIFQIVESTPGARIIAVSKLITRSGQAGETKAENTKHSETVKFQVKNSVLPDGQTIALELAIDYLAGQDATTLTTTTSVLSDHPIALVSQPPHQGKTLLVIVTPQILKNPSPETSTIDFSPKFGDTAPAHEADFIAQLPAKIQQLDIDTANLEQVRNIFGEPLQYAWAGAIYDKDNLSERYIMFYPGHFHIAMMNDRIMEIRLEGPSGYVFGEGLMVGSPLEKAISVLGPPAETVEGKPNAFAEKVLYKNIDGKKGFGYYARPDKHIRIWIGDDIVRAIYLTRSGYSDGAGIKIKETDLPATSHTNENGHNIDKIDLPFVTDPAVKDTRNSVDYAPKFSLTVLLVEVPSDFSPLKEIFPDRITEYRYSVLAPENLAVFLDTTKATEAAKQVFLPMLSIYDREQAYFEIGHDGPGYGHYIEVINTLQPDKKTVELKLDWVCQAEEEKEMKLALKRAVVRLDHSLVVAGPVPNKDQVWLIFVTSHMQDYSSSQTSDSGPHSDSSPRQPDPNVKDGED